MSKYSALLLVLAIAAALLVSGCFQPAAPVKQGRDADGTYWRGAEKPRLTIYEFSDFECPNCKLAEPAVEQFLSQNQARGVRVVYRHFPLEQHPHSRLAAIASVCAGNEGKFWEYHDILFANNLQLEKSDLVLYAKQLNLSSSFESCLSSQAAAAAVDKDVGDALSRNVRATPSFVIGDIILEGNQPVDRLNSAADRALSQTS